MKIEIKETSRYDMLDKVINIFVVIDGRNVASICLENQIFSKYDVEVALMEIDGEINIVDSFQITDTKSFKKTLRGYMDTLLGVCAANQHRWIDFKSIRPAMDYLADNREKLLSNTNYVFDIAKSIENEKGEKVSVVSLRSKAT